MMKRLRHHAERGNAILISLIIMAATLTISLGIAAIVGSEIKTTGLMVPSERAYYKSESFVEQALWNKTKGPSAPNYQVDDKSALGTAGYVCATAPCFQTDPRSTQSLLKRFSANTQPPNGEVTLEQDDPEQLDIGTNGSMAGISTPPKITLENIRAVSSSDQNPITSYRGLEVTIIAFPTGTTTRNFTSTATGQVTNTFVDKKLVPATATSQTFNLTGTQNPLGEAYPPLSEYTYRVRIKALGSDAATKVSASARSGSTDINLPLYAPDYTALAVTEDGRAQRGVQAVIPNVPQVLGIFDYVLFADMDLTKTDAKVPAQTQSINATVYNDTNRNCVLDTGDTVLPGAGVTATRGSETQSGTTGGDGKVLLSNLNSGSPGYTLSLTGPSGYSSCGTQSITLSGGQNATATLLTRPPLATTSALTQRVTRLASSPSVSCTSPGSQAGWPGRSVVLYGGGGQSTTTDSSGVASFTSLVENTAYSTSVAGKSGWQYCANLSNPGTNPGPSPAAAIPPGTTRTQTAVFAPVCTQVENGAYQWVDQYTPYWENWYYRRVPAYDVYDAYQKFDQNEFWGTRSNNSYNNGWYYDPNNSYHRIYLFWSGETQYYYQYIGAWGWVYHFTALNYWIGNLYHWEQNYQFVSNPVWQCPSP